MAAGAMLGADDGQKLASRDGSCQVTVPANWEIGSTGGIGHSAGKTNTVAVSSPPRISTFDALKQNARKAYEKDKVTRIRRPSSRWKGNP